MFGFSQKQSSNFHWFNPHILMACSDIYIYMFVVIYIYISENNMLQFWPLTVYKWAYNDTYI